MRTFEFTNEQIQQLCNCIICQIDDNNKASLKVSNPEIAKNIRKENNKLITLLNYVSQGGV